MKKSSTKSRKKMKRQVSGKRKNKSAKPICYRDIVKKIKKHVLKRNPSNINTAILIALKAAGNLKKNKQKIKSAPRVIPVPKTGGILPLIPIFAGLSALGALSGGAAGIAKAVNDAKAARKQLEESNRHNKTMESIALGGRGLFLKPYKSGLGLFLRPPLISESFR